jgi:hypothetical protein
MCHQLYESISCMSKILLQRSRPNGPRVTPLPTVKRRLACLSNVCRSPNRVPDSRCGLLFSGHALSRPRRWCWVWGGRARLGLDSVWHTWATAREAASQPHCHCLLQNKVSHRRGWYYRRARRDASVRYQAPGAIMSSGFSRPAACGGLFHINLAPVVVKKSRQARPKVAAAKRGSTRSNRPSVLCCASSI